MFMSEPQVVTGVVVRASEEFLIQVLDLWYQREVASKPIAQAKSRELNPCHEPRGRCENLADPVVFDDEGIQAVIILSCPPSPLDREAWPSARCTVPGMRVWLMLVAFTILTWPRVGK